MKKRNIKEYFKYSVILIEVTLLLLLFTGCNDQPTDIGYSFLKDTINTKTLSSYDTTIILKTFPFVYRDTIFSKGALFVGHSLTKSGDMYGVSMVRFGLIPDTLNYVTANTIDSAVLELPMTLYAIGDSLNPNALSFKVYEIIKFWDNHTVWDSIFTGSFPTTDFFDYSKPLATFNGQIKQDTVTGLSMQIDKSLIARWFSMQHDSLQRGNIYGIAFVPDESSTVIRRLAGISFLNSDYHPKITVYYRDSLNTNVQDTVSFSTAIDWTIANSQLLQNDSSVTIQGGVIIRSQIDIDISMIPDLSAVHYASLDLTLDTAHSIIGNYGYDSILFAIHYNENDNKTILNTYYGSRVTDSITKYTFPDITTTIENLVKTGKKKGSLIITPNPSGDEQDAELNRLVFFGVNDPNKNNRPKLKIIYSTRPKPQEKK